MRPPWLQVMTDFLETGAQDLAVLLFPGRRTTEADEARAGWAALQMVKWFLARCPPDRPPSTTAVVEGQDAARLIATGAGYRGDPELFAKACSNIRPALLEAVEGGLRLKEAARYDGMWAKNNPGLARAWAATHPEWKPHRDRDGTEPEPGRDRVGNGPEPPRPRPEAEPVAARDRAESVPESAENRPARSRSRSRSREEPPPPPAGAAAPSDQHHDPRDLWRCFQEYRVGARKPREGRPPNGFDAWVLRARSAGHSDQQLLLGYDNFLRDGTITTPQHPTGVWIHPDVWPTRIPPPAEEPAQRQPSRPDWAPPPDPRAEAAWGAVLAQLEEEGREYAVAWLRRLVPASVVRDELRLLAVDRWMAGWVADLYGPLIAATAATFELQAVLGVAGDETARRPLRAVPDVPSSSEESTQVGGNA